MAVATKRRVDGQGTTTDIVTTPTLHQIGNGGHAVLVIDDLSGDAGGVADIAARLAPFPPAEGSAYPGTRRHITPNDTAAADYAQRALRAAVPAINSAFGTRGFDLLDASFSMVTARPATLSPMQRSPHFDSVDPDYLAVLHYISGVAGSGTAFYRQRATGIERVTADNNAAFVAEARRASAEADGYIGGSNDWFERIGGVDAVADRLIVYQGSLLHSGVIAPDMAFSDDPRTGRLTANFFVRGRR